MLLYLLHNIGTITYAKCIEDNPTTTTTTTHRPNVTTTTHHITNGIGQSPNVTCPPCICPH